MDDARDLVWRCVNQAQGIGMLVIGVDGAIVWSNEAGSSLFGVRHGNLAGRRYVDLFTEEDRAIGAMETELAIAVSRGFSEDDRWHQRVDGSRFWANGVLTLIRSDDGALLGYGKQVRNRLDVKEQIVALRAELAACHGRVRRHIEASAEAAHELRNTMSSMAAVAGALRFTGNLPPEKLAQLADSTERQLAVAKRLTDDLMHAASAQRATPDLALEPVALQSLLREAVELVGNLREERRIDVLAPPAPIVCHTDRERLMQVATNLLRNAIKFTASDGRIWLRLTVEGSTAVVRVEDNGIGIAADMLERIFDAFTQVEESTASTGIGMGLTVARQTMRMLGGSIQASSDGRDKGAVFTVRLPVQR